MTRYVLLWIAVCTCALSRADMLLSEQSIEMMKEQQGADGQALGRLFGPDGASLLQFNSFVDRATGAFHYSLAPGTTYEGQTLSLSAIGAYDPVAQTWSLSSSGSLGAQSWTETGSGAIMGDPWSTVDFNFDLTNVNPPLLDYHASVTYEQTATRTVSVGDYRFTVNGFTVAQLQGLDNLILQGPNAGNWEWNLTPVTGANFRVDSFGMSPLEGGTGLFTMRVSAVPEPGAWLTVGCVLLTLGTISRRKR